MWLRTPLRDKGKEAKEKAALKASPTRKTEPRSPLSFFSRRVHTSKSQVGDTADGEVPPPLALTASKSQVSGEELLMAESRTRELSETVTGADASPPEESLFFPMELEGEDGGSGSGSGKKPAAKGDGDSRGGSERHKSKRLTASPVIEPQQPLCSHSVKREWLETVADFLLDNVCYRLMPSSSKVLVLDAALSVKQAFHALIAHDYGLGPVYNSQVEEYVGMFTCVDFIDILMYYYHESPIHHNIGDDLEEDTIQEWKDTEREQELDPDFPRGLVSIDPSSSLYLALSVMSKHHIHVLPLVDLESASNNVLGMVRMSQILQFILANIGQQSKIMKATLENLGIGTYMPNLVTVRKDTPLIQVFKSFAKRKMTGIPIVDREGVLVGVYERSDVMNLALDGTYHNLDQCVFDVWKAHRKSGDVVWKHTCTRDETLESVTYKLASRHLHRLVCVDDNFRPIGVVSLSDVLSVFLVYGTRLRDTSTVSPRVDAAKTGFWSPRTAPIPMAVPGGGGGGGGTHAPISGSATQPRTAGGGGGSHTGAVTRERSDTTPNGSDDGSGRGRRGGHGHGQSEEFVPMSLPRELGLGMRGPGHGGRVRASPPSSPLSQELKIDRMISDVGPGSLDLGADDIAVPRLTRVHGPEHERDRKGGRARKGLHGALREGREATD